MPIIKITKKPATKIIMRCFAELPDSCRLFFGLLGLSYINEYGFDVDCCGGGAGGGAGGGEFSGCISIMLQVIGVTVKPQQKTACFQIDNLTATLRTIVSTNTNLLGEGYGLESDRRTFIDIAKELGIDATVANDITAEVQKKGVELGLEVKNLQ